MTDGRTEQADPSWWEGHQSEDIWIAAMRQRPGMYVGSADERGVHRMLWGVVAEGIHEYLAGRAGLISVRILADGGVCVAHDGQTYAIEQDHTGEGTLQDALTGGPHLPAREGSDRLYAYYGASLPAVNGLSARLVADVRRDGATWRQEYVRGKAQGRIVRVGPAEGPSLIITFWPDPAIFGPATFRRDLVWERLREACYLNAGLLAEVGDTGLAAQATTTFHFPDGVRSYVRVLNAGQKPLHEPISASNTVGTTRISVALQYHAGGQETLVGYANGYVTQWGGTHVAGFHDGLRGTLNTLGEQAGLLDNGPLGATDVRAGLCAVVSVWVDHVQNTGNMGLKLINPDIQAHVAATTREALTRHFKDNPADLSVLVEHLRREPFMGAAPSPVTNW